MHRRQPDFHVLIFKKTLNPHNHCIVTADHTGCGNGLDSHRKIKGLQTFCEDGARTDFVRRGEEAARYEQRRYKGQTLDHLRCLAH